MDDADICIVSYGASARTAYAAVDEDARRDGIKVGLSATDNGLAFSGRSW